MAGAVGVAAVGARPRRPRLRGGGGRAGAGGPGEIRTLLLRLQHCGGWADEERAILLRHREAAAAARSPAEFPPVQGAPKPNQSWRLAR